MANPLQFSSPVRLPSLSWTVSDLSLPTLPSFSEISPVLDQFGDSLQRLPRPSQGKFSPWQIQDNTFTQKFKNAEFITEAKDQIDGLIEGYSRTELVIGGAGITALTFGGAYLTYKTAQLSYRAVSTLCFHAMSAFRYITTQTPKVPRAKDNQEQPLIVKGQLRPNHLDNMRREPRLGDLGKTHIRDSQAHVPTEVKAAPPAQVQINPNPQTDFPSITGYTITQFIAGGGMGAVYRARETATGLDVAIKIMKPDLSDPKFIDRFAKETKNLLNVHSRYVVRYRASGKTDKNEPFLVLDFIPGGTLSKVTRDRGLFSNREAIDIVLKIAEGFAAMDEKDIVHRDIKPANIMLTPKKRNISGDALPALNLESADWDTLNWGQVNVNNADWTNMPWAKLNIDDFEPVIVDFGLSRSSDITQTLSSEAMGTPSYMPIEQYDPDAKLDIRTDLCALGYTLYYMLNSSSPFGDLNHKYSELRRYQETSESERLVFMQTYLRQTPRLHPELKKFINKATHPDRDLRYPNAQAFINALKRVRDRLS